MEKKYQNIEEYANDFANHMSIEFIKILKAGTKKSGKVVQQDIMIKSIGTLVQLMLEDILTDEDNDLLSKEEIVSKITKNFKNTKFHMSRVIGDAFANVMSKYSGTLIEYICTIKIVEELKRGMYL